VESAEGLRVIQSIFPDQLSVPCVPTIFRASNPPPEVDVGAHKSDPPIPGSTAIEGQNVFRWPPIIKEVDAPEVEEDSLTSSDESSAGEDPQQQEGDDQGSPTASDAPGADLDRGAKGGVDTMSAPTPTPVAASLGVAASSPATLTTTIGTVHRGLRVPKKLIVKRAKI